MDPHSEQRSLAIIHIALVMGCLMFLVVAWNLGPLDATDRELSDIFLVLGAAALGLVPISFLVFRLKLREGPFMLEEPKGFGKLRAALIVHYALIEVPCMLNIVLLLITGSMVHAWLALACMAILVLRAPTAAMVQAWATGGN